MDVHTSRRRSRAVRLPALAVLAAVALSGCSPEVQRGWLPGYDDGIEVTNHTERIATLWTGSWIAAVGVGVVVWGLILWCVAVYRKRKDDDVLPVQLRYHLPLEIMYIILPLIMVGVLYFYTARDMDALAEMSGEPDNTIEVYGKQWSWDFNYLDEDVHESGVHLFEPGVEDSSKLPTLYLPVNESVEFQLRSRDVIHSFWVPAFLYKLDVFPGDDVNSFEVTPTRVGTYAGKCAELCGEFHAGMLFNVEVVEREEYDRQMDLLREKGQTGRLGPELDRSHSGGADNATSDGEG